MQKKLFLLDAMALIYRAYYAMVKSPRITSKGVNTSATLGFTNTLYEVLRQEQPTHIAVAFDTGAPTLRHADFAAYKANREATPDDIINSIPYIKKVIVQPRKKRYWPSIKPLKLIVYYHPPILTYGVFAWVFNNNRYNSHRTL